MASSYLFIGVKVQTFTETLFGELEHYGRDYNVDGIDGTYRLDPQNFESITSIVTNICDWFVTRLDDCVCSKETDEIIANYGRGDFSKIMISDLSSINTITIFSRMEYYDEPNGVSLLKYDVATSKLQETHRCWEDSDPFGEDLALEYEQRPSLTSNTSKKVKTQDIVVLSGFTLCSACRTPYPTNEMVMHEVDGIEYPFCPKCSRDFFEE